MKACTKPTAHNFNVFLTPQFNSSRPLLNNNACNKIQNVTATLKRPEAEQWWAAMESEIKSINEKGTWILVPRPKDHQVITSKWLLKRKLNPDRSLHCHKARLVALGFSQLVCIDFHETFSPTLIITSLRTTIGVVAQLNLYIHQIDIKTTFLNGDLNQPIYMEQPKYFKDTKHLDFVCLLKKTLYGLKQSPRIWYYRLH